MPFHKIDLPEDVLKKWYEIMGSSGGATMSAKQRTFMTRFLRRMREAGLEAAKCQTFGIPNSQLGPEEYGLVVSPAASKGRSKWKYGRHINPQHLRFALLFWDKIDYPLVEIRPLPLNEDESLLYQAGILERTIIKDCIGWKIKDVYFEAPETSFVGHEHAEPGRWALGTEDLAQSETRDTDERALLLSLYRCALVPAATVPIYDILEFKERRRVELLAFRHALHEVYESIQKSPDRPLAKQMELERLDRAISDHLRSAKEWKMPFVLTDVQAKLDAKALGAGAATAWAASAAGLSAASSSLAAAGATALAALSMTFGLRRETAQRSPFQYISHFHKEVY